MRLGRPGLALEPLRTLFVAGTVAGVTDGELLHRFAARRDEREDGGAEAAFAALVARHGPMVRRVCRLLLGDPNDADDAFQATFLVLARKAGAIRRPDLLGNWLYGTAQRAARKLRTRAALQSKHEMRGAIMALARAWTASDEIAQRAALCEEARIVHEEVDRLPRVCRVAVVLCELEGLKHDEVARCLGCTDRTLRRRLVRARELLRVRLTRRGLAPTAGLLAVDLGPEPASAAIPRITVEACSLCRGPLRSWSRDGRDRCDNRLRPRGRSDRSDALGQFEGDRDRVGSRNRARRRRRGRDRCRPGTRRPRGWKRRAGIVGAADTTAVAAERRT